MTGEAALISRLSEAYAHAWKEVQPGLELDEYLLVRRVGFGRYAEVWLVEDRTVGQAAVVKIFTPHRFPDGDRREAAERFFKGATAMARLDSEHVARLRCSPRLSDGYLWFSMDYFEQGDLGKALAERRLACDDCVQIFEDVVSALSHAHGRGVVHRDVRPSNVLLRMEGNRYRAVLADFDMAYWDNILFSDVSTIAVLSLPRYLPNDVVRAGRNHPDLKTLIREPSNDLFAACVVLLDMFIGLSASTEEGDETHFREMIATGGRSFRNAAQVPSSTAIRVSKLLSVALQGKARDRYSSAHELQSAWRGGVYEPRIVFRVGLLASTALLVTLLLIAEATHGALAGTVSGRLLNGIAVGLTGIGAIPICAWVYGRWRAQFSEVRLSIGAALAATALRRKITVLLSFAVPICLAALCGPQRRTWSYRVTSAKHCHLVSSTGKDLAGVETAEREVIEGVDAERLMCPKDVVLDARIYPRSVFAPAVDVREMPVDAGVDARSAVDASVDAAPQPPPRLIPEPPPTERVLVEQLLVGMSGDDAFKAILDNESRAWPAYVSAARRISDQLNIDELNSVVDLQDEAMLEAKRQSDRLRTHDVSSGSANRWRALAGHLACIAMKCNKGLSYLADAATADRTNSIIWIGDALRCLSDQEQSSAVRNFVGHLPLDADGKERFQATLVWVATNSDIGLARSGARWRAAVMLNLLEAPWDEQREVVVRRVLRESGNCVEVRGAAEVARKYMPEQSMTLAQLLEERKVCRDVVDVLRP